MTITFHAADAQRDRALLLDLNIRYFEWLAESIRRDFALEVAEMVGGSIPAYVASMLDKLCGARPPEGVFYIVRRDGTPAGMGGVRRLAAGTSEMKRVFVLPDHRGSGLGGIIVKRLVADSDSFGYSTMMLETGPFMTSAHRLYEAERFRDRAVYEGAEVPTELHYNWRFMERSLAPGPAAG